MWHEPSGERVKVTVSETHIETLFCQKNEGTDGKFTGNPTKVCVKQSLQLVVTLMRAQAADFPYFA